MKILVTGANGMVGKAVIAYCKESGDAVKGLNRDQLDISDGEQVTSIVTAENPDAIINCAAYTDVDGSETNQELCWSVNATGVENLALAARKINCSFLTVSTDYVFDGGKDGFYTQRDTPNPVNYYGKAKLEGERLASYAYARSIVVRTGWVFGKKGSNFLSSMHKLLGTGNRIRAIEDSYGTPTFAGDLAARMRRLIEIDLPLTYHVVNSGSRTSFYEFALEVCEINQLDKSLVEGSLADSLQRPAKRPVNSSLECLYSAYSGIEPMPGWQESLRLFIEQEKNSDVGNPNT